MNTHSLRFTLIDWLRAFAIFLMVIYHFCFDLQAFGLMSQELFAGPFFTAIGRTCLSLFMFCVGYSLAISHANGIHWQKFWKRWIKVAAAAALVSLATYLTYPKHWIYFGILHCITLTSLLLLPCLKLPRLALIIGLCMLIAYAGFNLDFSLPGFLAQFGWQQDFITSLANRESLDCIPIYPWSWSAWIGIWAHSQQWHQKIPLPFSPLATKLSQHSLLIYLIHQPILMALAYITVQLLG